MTTVFVACFLAGIAMPLVWLLISLPIMGKEDTRQDAPTVLVVAGTMLLLGGIGLAIVGGGA